jgi:hypothetical protein
MLRLYNTFPGALLHFMLLKPSSAAAGQTRPSVNKKSAKLTDRGELSDHHPGGACAATHVLTMLTLRANKASIQPSPEGWTRRSR